MVAKVLDALGAIKEKYAGALMDDAVPFVAQNASDITTTTAVEIKATPGAGKRIVVTQVVVTNKTPAEAAVITLQDDAGTPVPFLTVAVSTAAANGGQVIMELEPPVKMAANVALDGVAGGALGDTVVTAFGFVESVPS